MEKTRKLLPVLIVICLLALFFIGLPFIRGYFNVSPDKIIAWFPHFAPAWLLIRSRLASTLIYVLLVCITAYLILSRRSIWRFAKTHKAEIILATLSTVIALTAVEIALRADGYVPGLYAKPGPFMKVVPQLVLYQGYLADTNAMTCIDPGVAGKLHRYLAGNLSGDTAGARERGQTGFDNVAADIGSLAGDYAGIILGRDTGEFADFYRSLLRKPRHTSFDSLICNYVFNPVNSDGFRSVEFRRQSNKKRILLIGDSFVYGMSATSILRSFYDILLARGYEVYNTGLPGSDPPQYLAVAQKYIPLLKPDIVIVNFFMGNDVQYYRQNFRPYQPFSYRTNAGFFSACPLGVDMKDAQEAYEISLQNISVPTGGSLIKTLCSKLVITTLLLNRLNRLPGLQYQTNKTDEFCKQAKKYEMKYPDANDRLAQIEKLCKENNSKFVISIIPWLEDNEGARVKLLHARNDRLLFSNLPYVEDNEINAGWYCTGGNMHFNDKGHKEYAGFLQSIIDSLSAQ